MRGKPATNGRPAPGTPGTGRGPYECATATLLRLETQAVWRVPGKPGGLRRGEGASPSAASRMVVWLYRSEMSSCDQLKGTSGSVEEDRPLCTTRQGRTPARAVRSRGLPPHPGEALLPCELLCGPEEAASPLWVGFT